MSFEKIESQYEEIWLYHLISHLEFVDNSFNLPQSDDKSLFSPFQQVILKEMAYYIYSLAGIVDKAIASKESLETKNEFVISKDPLVTYFILGVNLWHEYMFLNNSNIQKVQEQQRIIKKLFNSIKEQYKDNNKILKYLIPYYAIFGSIYRKYGIYGRAYQLLNDGFTFSLKIGNPLYLVISYFNFREIFEDTLEISKALEIGSICIEKLRNLEAYLYEAYVLYDMGWLSYKVGDLQKSLLFFERAIKLYSLDSQLNKTSLNGLITCFNQLGRIHCIIGQLDKSLEYYNKALELYRTIQDRKNPSLLANLGEYYNLKGNYNSALEFQLEALDIRNKKDFSGSNQLPLANSYFHLIKLYVHFNEYEKAKTYLNYLKELQEKWLDKEISTQYKIATAILLKEKMSLNDLSKSQKILTEIIKEPSSSIELTTTALVLLIEISLIEYKFFHNDDNREKLRLLIEKLRSYSEDKFIFLSINVIILKGTLELVEGALEYAEKLFYDALNLAERYNIVNLVEEINEEISRLNDEILTARNIINSNINIKKRIETLEIEKYIEDMQGVLSLFKG